jgi:hypothetical protein
MNTPQNTSHITEGVTVQSLCALDRQYLPPSASPSRLEAQSEEERQHESKRAQKWLTKMLASHDKFLNREHCTRMFRFAIEKELAGARDQWSDVERLCMVLTDPNIPDTKQRLVMAVLLVFELNFADNLAHVSKLATQRHEVVQRTSELAQKASDIRSKMSERMQEDKVDYFACTVPLASLKLRPDIVDDNQGCCPICRNSYTDLSTYKLEELLADFPVRIKYCGHVIGKACLEQWMSTPKIDEAKYPYRTCPLCRVKIEGVKLPSYPQSLRRHIKTDGRAMETLKELLYCYDMEKQECLDTIASCMSEEIACEELLKVVKDMAGETRWGYEKDEKTLEEKMEKLKEERWVWGFRGDRNWKRIRNEWMRSGVVEKE